MAQARLPNDKVPIFTIPGIFGDALSTSHLKSNLEFLSKNIRDVYAFTDPRHIQDNSIPPSNLSELCSTMANGILQGLKRYPKDTPCLLVGYSFGGMLAAEVAKRLKEHKLNVFVYIIDTVPIPLSQKYFKSGNLQATQDLIGIIDYISLQTGLKSQSLSFSSAQVEQISKLNLADQLNKIIELYVGKDFTKINNNTLSNFHRYTKIVSENYIFLQQYHSQAENKSFLADPIIDGVFALMTEETIKKYGENPWFGSINTKSFMQDIHKDVTHTQLVSQQYAGVVANSILGFFDKALNALYSKNTVAIMEGLDERKSSHSPVSGNKILGNSYRQFKPQPIRNMVLGSSPYSNYSESNSDPGPSSSPALSGISGSSSMEGLSLNQMSIQGEGDQHLDKSSRKKGIAHRMLDDSSDSSLGSDSESSSSPPLSPIPLQTQQTLEVTAGLSQLMEEATPKSKNIRREFFPHQQSHHLSVPGQDANMFKRSRPRSVPRATRSHLNRLKRSTMSTDEDSDSSMSPMLRSPR